MSSHVVSQPGGGRLRGGTWRYAAPSAFGAGAAKFRENLRRLGGEDLLPVDRTTAAPASSTPDATDPDGRRPGRPRPVR